MHIHSRHYTIQGAKAAERAYITDHHLLSKKGYNTLPGAPGASRLFWTMHTKGRLKSQHGAIATLLPHLHGTHNFQDS